jgi:glycosyltransferase involved in cell wall biosynthesis
VKLGIFVTPGSGLPNGNTAYWDGLLAGLLAQTRHDIVVVASERAALPEVPHRHEVVRVRHPRQRFVGALNFDVHADVFAAFDARRAGVGALIANAQWPMPRPRGVAHIAVLYEAAFLEPAPWGVYSTYAARQFTRVPRRNVRHAHAVVTLSASAREQIATHLPVARDRIVIAPPSLRPFPSCARSRYQPPGKYVLAVGWFHPRRDITLTLRAWRAAIARGLDADLVLAGTEGPPDRRYGTVGRRILDVVGPDLAARVYFTGSIPRGDLGALYRDASALVMTSLHEGFGLPAIEAFSFGIPVVAVDRTSLREVVDPAGTVVPPDADEIATALIDAVVDPGDAAARRAYASSFTVERQVAPYLEIADQIEAAQ